MQGHKQNEVILGCRQKETEQQKKNRRKKEMDDETISIWLIRHWSSAGLQQT